MKILKLIIVLNLFLACNPTKLLILSKDKENFYRPEKGDTLKIKSLSVIDRFRYDKSFFKKSPYYLVKDKKATTSILEDAFYEITDSNRYEYSYPFVLKTIENLIFTNEFPILLNKNFSYKNDSLFKPLLNDSLFNIGFDTNHTKNLLFSVEDGIHSIVNVLRYYYPNISEYGHIVWLTIYFEFIEIKDKKLQKYICLERIRSGHSKGLTTLKKHRWRIMDDDTRLVFKKLFESN